MTNSPSKLESGVPQQYVDKPGVLITLINFYESLARQIELLFEGALLEQAEHLCGVYLQCVGITYDTRTTVKDNAERMLAKNSTC